MSFLARSVSFFLLILQRNENVFRAPKIFVGPGHWARLSATTSLSCLTATTHPQAGAVLSFSLAPDHPPSFTVRPAGWLLRGSAESPRPPPPPPQAESPRSPWAPAARVRPSTPQRSRRVPAAPSSSSGARLRSACRRGVALVAVGPVLSPQESAQILSAAPSSLRAPGQRPARSGGLLCHGGPCGQLVTSSLRKRGLHFASDHESDSC